MKKKLKRITAFLLLSVMLITSTGFESVFAADTNRTESVSPEAEANSSPEAKKVADGTSKKAAETTEGALSAETELLTVQDSLNDTAVTSGEGSSVTTVPDGDEKNTEEKKTEAGDATKPEDDTVPEEELKTEESSKPETDRKPEDTATEEAPSDDTTVPSGEASDLTEKPSGDSDKKGNGADADSSEEDSKAESTFKKIKPAAVVNGETGTDLDNFDIRLSWGDPGDNIGDTLTINNEDGSNQEIKLQVTVEYRGTEHYDVEDLSFELATLRDKKYSFDSSIYEDDIAAEDKEGGEKRGEWYYERTEFKKYIQDILGNEYPVIQNNYKFTNKFEINGAFTSSFQIVMRINKTKGFFSEFEKTFKTNLKVREFDKLLSSNSVSLQYQASKVQKYEMISNVSPLKNGDSIIYKIPEGKTKDDYIFADVEIRISGSSKYGATPVYNEFYARFPEDVIVSDMFRKIDYGYYSTFYGESTIYQTEDSAIKVSCWDNWGYLGYNENPFHIVAAFPKDTYKTLSNFKQDVVFSTSYLKEDGSFYTEKYNYDIDINFPEIDFPYTGSLVSLSVTTRNGGYTNERLDLDYFKETKEWYKYPHSAINIDVIDPQKPYDIILGTDLAYWHKKDNTVRQLNDDEQCVQKIDLWDINEWFVNGSIELRGKCRNTSDYVHYKTLYPEDVKKYGVYTLSLEDEGFSDVKLIFHNITGGINIDEIQIISSYAHNSKIDDVANIDAIYTLPYLDVLVDNKNIVNGLLPNTNVESLRDLIEEYDINKYNELKFRGFDGYNVKKDKLYINTLMNTNKTNVNNNNISFIPELTASVLEDTIGRKLLNYDCSIILPKEFNLNLDGYEWDRNHIAFTETKASDSTIINIHGDYEDSPLNTMQPDYSSGLHLFEQRQYNSNTFSLDTPLDDYFLKKLEGTSFEYNVTLTCNFEDGYIGSNTYKGTGKYPSVAKASYQGVEQEAKSSLSNGYSKNEIGVLPGQEYSYKLRLGAGNSKMKYMQYFLNLEQDFKDNEHWSGIFNGIDVSAVEESFEKDVKIYYSDNPNQKHDLSEAGWVEEKNWTKTLNDVKSVAVDFGDCIIGDGNAVYATVKMIAPDNKENTGLLAYNKFTASYKSYDINEKNPDETNYIEDVKNLPSNVTTVRLGETEKTISMTIEWDDENDKYDMRPDTYSYAVVLYQDGREYMTVKMNSDWTKSVQVPIYKNENGEKYIYSVKQKEDYTSKGYTTDIKQTDTNYGEHFLITNTMDMDKFVLVNLNIIWKDNNNKLGIRPNKQTVNVKSGNTIYICSVDNSNEWKYQMIREKKDKNGNLITYTIEPVQPSPYSTTFIGGITESGDYDFTITNELSYEDVMTSIPVVKEWDDEEDTYQTRPESIKVKVLQDGQSFSEAEITAEDGWQKDIQVPKYKNWDMEEYQYSVEELPVDKYDSQLEVSTGEEGNYKLTFDGQSRTEGTSYDYVEIYYNLDGETYKAGKWGGTDIKGKSVVIPTKDFYVYWRTDSSGDAYWGYAISSIEKTEEEAVSGTQASLPDVTVKNTSSKFDLQSNHNGNYGNNIKELWYYTPEYYLITNTLDKTSVTTEISGVKVWQDEENAYNTRPDEITVNLVQDGKKFTSTTTNADKNWKYTFTDVPVFKNDTDKYEYTISEEQVEGYDYEYQKNNLAYKGNVEIVFDGQSETESINYDFVEIYYEQDGKMMKTGPFGGKGSSNKIAGASVVVPTTDFYVYWKTDNSNDSYYGYRVESVHKTEKEVTKSTTATLPSGVDRVNTEDINDLQSKHGSYGNNVKELWHYSAKLKGDEFSHDLVNTLDTSVLSGNIEITQVVDEVDLSHGNPTFIIQATNGSNTYYETISFDKAGEQTVTMDGLPSGEYTVTVKQPPRYELTDITDLENAKRDGDSVKVTIQGNTGKATFVSEKRNWKNFSHSDVVVNKVNNQ